MAQKITIAELDIDIDALLKKYTDTRKEIDLLKDVQKILEQQGKKNTKQFAENEIALTSLSSSANQQKRTLAELTNENNRLTTIQGALTNAIGKEINTIENARKNNKELLSLRNKLNLSTEEGRRQADLLNKKLDENNAFIKENVSAYEKQKIGIGDYEGAIRKVFPAGGEFFSMVTQMKEGLMAKKAALQAASVGTTGLSKGLNILKVALISTGIGAIVVALGLLVKGFLSTQAGIDKVTAVTRPLKAIMESLFGVIQNVATSLVDAFKNPKQLMIDIADFVKTNLINRFKAFKVILDGIIERDFKKIADGFIQAGTGVEGATDKIKNAKKEAGEFLDEAIKKGQELDRLEKELRQTRIANRTETGRLTEELKKQNQIAEDQNRPIAEREEAAKKSIQVAKDLNALKQKELDLEIAILQNKQDRNDTSDEEKLQLADLIAKKNEANAQELEKTTTQTNKLNTIRKEANAKALDLRNKQKEAEIQSLNEELNLFINQQDLKKKSLEDELLFEATVSQKRLDILKKEFEAGKISKTAYESEKLAITNEFTQKQIDASLQVAQRELDIYVKNIQSKIDNDTFFSDEKLRMKLEENKNIALKELEFQKLRLESGVINEQEYLDAIDNVKENQRIKNEEAEKLREEAKKEKDLIDLENKRIIDEENFMTEFEIKLSRLQREREAELLKAEKTGADTTLIRKKYNKREEALEKEKSAVISEVRKASISEFATLVDQQSEAGKAVALYQAGINVQEGVTKALAQGGLFGFVGAAAVAAKGAISISKIFNAKEPKFESGGLMEIGGQRHSQGGTKFYGEDGTRFEAEKGELIGVMSRNASRHFMAFNNSFTRKSSIAGKYATGGLIRPLGANSDTARMTNEFASIVAQEINKVKVVTVVDDVTDMQVLQSDIVNGANI